MKLNLHGSTLSILPGKLGKQGGVVFYRIVKRFEECFFFFAGPCEPARVFTPSDNESFYKTDD